MRRHCDSGPDVTNAHNNSLINFFQWFQMKTSLIIIESTIILINKKIAMILNESKSKENECIFGPRGKNKLFSHSNKSRFWSSSLCVMEGSVTQMVPQLNFASISFEYNPIDMAFTTISVCLPCSPMLFVHWARQMLLSADFFLYQFLCSNF